MPAPRVDFYSLATEHQMMHFVCRLTNKIWRTGEEVYLYTESKAAAEQLDNELWVYQDISFVPHTLAAADDILSTPIVIGWPELGYERKDIIVNLTTKIPDWVGDFSRIVELVPADDRKKIVARERFRDYKNRHFDVHHHKI